MSEGLSCRGGTSVVFTVRDRLHLETWELVEHRWDWVECFLKTMSEPSDFGYRDASVRGRSVADVLESDCEPGRLAIYNRRRTHQTKKTIP